MDMNLDTSINNLAYLLFMSEQDNDDNGGNENKDLEIFRATTYKENQ